MVPDRDKRRCRESEARDRAYRGAAERLQRQRRWEAEEPVPDEHAGENGKRNNRDTIAPNGLL